MYKIAHTALAGLHAAETRLAVRANNISNAFTPAFEPDQVHQTAVPDQGPFVQVTRGGIPEGYVNPPNGFGFIATGNKVNLAAEMTDFVMAEISYKANLAVLKSASDLEKESIEILT